MLSGVPHDTSIRLPLAATDGAASPASAKSSVVDADTTPAVSTVAASMRSPGKRNGAMATVSRHVMRKRLPLHATAGDDCVDDDGVSGGITPEAMLSPSLLGSEKRITPDGDCQAASHSFPSNATDGALPAASCNVAITAFVVSLTMAMRIFDDSTGPSSHSSIVRPAPAA